MKKVISTLFIAITFATIASAKLTIINPFTSIKVSVNKFEGQQYILNDVVFSDNKTTIKFLFNPEEEFWVQVGVMANIGEEDNGRFRFASSFENGAQTVLVYNYEATRCSNNESPCMFEEDDIQDITITIEDLLINGESLLQLTSRTDM